MKDSKLQFDREVHVLYSKTCKKEIRAKIALHYLAAEKETGEVCSGNMRTFYPTGVPIWAVKRTSTTVQAAPMTVSQL